MLSRATQLSMCHCRRVEPIGPWELEGTDIAIAGVGGAFSLIVFKTD